MTSREATCSCGQLRLSVEGEPLRISVCHCLACQRRTGSVFGVQARFHEDKVQVSGQRSEYTRTSDEGDERTFAFCPSCGATVFFRTSQAPAIVGVPVGAFADSAFPPPTISVFESRRHSWITVPTEMEHQD
jgi:hypothetical protein